VCRCDIFRFSQIVWNVTDFTSFVIYVIVCFILSCVIRSRDILLIDCPCIFIKTTPFLFVCTLINIMKTI